MTPPLPLAGRLLAPVEEVLLSAVGDNATYRLDVLEAAAAGIGGCDLTTLRKTDDQARGLPIDDALILGDLVRAALPRVPMHPALALASLAQPVQSPSDRRRAGAYYTDFRLARFLVERLPADLGPDASVVDPASGTGVLLVAAALRFATDKAALDHFVANSVCAADVSSDALRGVKLALASLTCDDRAVESMAGRLRQRDSLVAGPDAWSDIAPGGFSLVIGNPPWEKLKLSRHEFLTADGVERHYGADYVDEPEGLSTARARMTAYVRDLLRIYADEGNGDVDLYRLFVALSVRLAAAEGGQLAMLVPAGLIRARSAESMRRDLFGRASKLQMAVLENRPRYFAIDSRFKFLALHALLGRSEPSSPLVVDHVDADATGASVVSSATLGRSKLKRLRPDLTVPEVRSPVEWRIYQSMAATGDRLGDLTNQWPLDITRELDMTNDREILHREMSEGALPLIEGRMVHQFHCGYKAYVSGSGRAARWRVADDEGGDLVPQYWVDRDSLPRHGLERALTTRIGFCDITGQTNERTMLAARIPTGAVCGNKVPTILLSDHPNPEEAADLWLAVVNSLAFDWLLRRLATTTVNYFVLRSVPFPDLSPVKGIGGRLAEFSGALSGSSVRRHGHEWADLRAEIDALVLRAYGLDLDAARVVLSDFPLLDRGQPTIWGEPRSTVTRDLVLDRLGLMVDDQDPVTHQRVEEAQAAGATAYVPAQVAAELRRASLSSIG